MPHLDLEGLPPSAMTFVEPMLLKPVSALPEGPHWQYEIKWDGYRALAIRTGSKRALISRRNHSFLKWFPSIAAGLDRLEDGSMLDGEIVAFDVHGTPSFDLLQQQASHARTLVYFVFDILAYRGRDVRRLELVRRREFLEAILQHAPDNVRSAPIVDASPRELIPAVKAQGLEGIVAKRIDSRYESRARSGAWVKLKVNDRRGFVGMVAGKKLGAS